MAKADLHVHSKYSEHSSDWFLKRIGANESYVNPDDNYILARQNGMDFVTITDHNRIDGSIYLQEKHPDHVFSGVELTTYFPEDYCKIHILVYGFSKDEFNEMNKLRENIYLLRDYIQRKNLAYSVAHATWSINNKLTNEHLEKLLLLFDIFEGINGHRDKVNNNGWIEILKNLTPEHLSLMQKKHKIIPISSDPWIKGITGGGDDHACLYVGKIYTEAEAESPCEFLEKLKDKNAISAAGKVNNYKQFAFNIYKIACDYSRERGIGQRRGFLSELNSLLFLNIRPGFASRIRLFGLINKGQRQKDRLTRGYYELINLLNDLKSIPANEKFDLIYEKISVISDEFFKSLFLSLEKDIESINIMKIIRDVSSFIPGIFLVAPFFTSIWHTMSGREITESFRNNLGINSGRKKRYLWLSDTIDDMNGVAGSVKNIGWYSYIHGVDVSIGMIENSSDEKNAGYPPGIVKIPSIYDFPLPYYDNINLKIPSVLKAVELIYDFSPDEIYISTPGPLGLSGLLAAKLLNIPVSGIFHTDFSNQFFQLTGNSEASKIIESYIRWFYSQMTDIKVPTMLYARNLKDRGYPVEKICRYYKALDTSIFKNLNTSDLFKKRLKAGPESIVLFYAGRISADKNIGFLLELFSELVKSNQNFQLILAGTGPDYNEYRKKARSIKQVSFIGRIDRNELPYYYSAAHLLVFPSLTDTFGMTVLEAQACGLPAVVSDIGGQKEIISEGITGFSAKANSISDWKDKILLIAGMIEKRPEDYRKMREAARSHVDTKYSWENVIHRLFSRDRMFDIEEDNNEKLKHENYLHEIFREHAVSDIF